MKALTKATIFAALVASVGCGEKSPPGGPGAGVNDRRTIGTPESAFRLSVPNETDVDQGMSKVVKIGVDRRKNFNQEVTLRFSHAPKGITVTPASATVQPAADSTEVTITAADAALGEHSLTVTGTPQSGAETFAYLKIEVEKP